MSSRLASLVVYSANDLEHMRLRRKDKRSNLSEFIAQLRTYITEIRKFWEEQPELKKFDLNVNKELMYGLSLLTGKEPMYSGDHHVYFPETLLEELHIELESLLDRLEKASIESPIDELAALVSSLVEVHRGMLAYDQLYGENPKKRCA